MTTLFLLAWSFLGFANLPYTAPLWANWLIHNPVQLFRWFAANLMGNLDAELFGKLVRSLLFVPYPDVNGDLHPLLGVGWTLNLEMFFYVLFAVALRINRRAAPLIVCVILVALKVINGYFGCGNVGYAFYAQGYTDYFIFGITSFYIWRALSEAMVARLRPIIIISGVTAALAFVAGNAGVIANPISYFMPVVVVLAALLFHSGRISCTWRPAMVMGNASYSLYLVHTIVLETIRPFGAQWAYMDFSQSTFGMMVALVTCSVIAVVVHYRVERPAIRALRRLTDGSNHFDQRATSSGDAQLPQVVISPNEAT
jgi:exopolysaccharide production protein ExoZ